MIKEELYRENLIRHYSDMGMKIRQVETGKLYDDAIDLIKKARETINKFKPNYRSKSRIRGNTSSTTHIVEIRNFPENKNYSFW